MDNNSKYVRVTAEDSNDYYCPLDIARSRDPLLVELLDDCVEADVVGRYMGHLDIQGRY